MSQELSKEDYDKFYELDLEKTKLQAQLKELEAVHKPLKEAIREECDYGLHKKFGYEINVTKGSTTKLDKNGLIEEVGEEVILKHSKKSEWKNIKIRRV